MPRKKGSKNKKKFPPTTPFRAVGLEYKKELVGEPYKLTLKSLGRIFKSEGQTLEEALRKIKISGGARVLSVLKVEQGEKVKDNIFIGADISQGLFAEVGPTRKDYAIRKAIERIGL